MIKRSRGEHGNKCNTDNDLAEPLRCFTQNVYPQRVLCHHLMSKRLLHPFAGIACVGYLTSANLSFDSLNILSEPVAGKAERQDRDGGKRQYTCRVPGLSVSAGQMNNSGLSPGAVTVINP